MKNFSQSILFLLKWPLIVSLASLLFAGCVTPVEEVTPYGLSPTKEGYVPARTALLSCIVWPERATRISGIPLSNIAADDLTKICSEYDQFVASGFDNQPFMKGLSPKLVAKLSASSPDLKPIQQAILEEWAHQSSDCQTCKTPAAFYSSSIAKRESWQLWLTNFAKATKGADAILLPLVLFYETARDNDRGLIVSRRAASVTLLLIDTSTGELIWSGGRESSVSTKVYAGQPGSDTLAPPPFDDLRLRLFTDAIFQGYPGRKIYR